MLRNKCFCTVTLVKVSNKFVKKCIVKLHLMVKTLGKCRVAHL